MQVRFSVVKAISINQPYQSKIMIAVQVRNKDVVYFTPSYFVFV